MKTCLLAASKIWHPDLPTQIEKRTSTKCYTITSPEQLTHDFLDDIKPSYIFFPHWSYLIPEAIFNRYECVVFHMTDLPFGRGGSPLQNLIVRGIETTQLSALRCEAGIDTGPIYLKKPLTLTGTAQHIYENASLIIEEMIIEILTNQPEPIPQQGEIVAFERRKPEQSHLIAVDDLKKVYDMIRMLDAKNYPHAYLETAHLRLEFTAAALEANQVTANVTITLKGKES